MENNNASTLCRRFEHWKTLLKPSALILFVPWDFGLWDTMLGVLFIAINQNVLLCNLVLYSFTPHTERMRYRLPWLVEEV